jgi:molybdopterin-biosynthesis enzyme MoeA-like protein
MSPRREFGVIIAGNELLSGKRGDKHLPHVIRVLSARGQEVVWCRIVGDDKQRLVHEFRQTRNGSIPVFCFGGIGATPDDRTRQAAATAFGVRLERHAEAARLIEQQFGGEAYPHRIRMAELPENCQLIPNACNRIPGFTLNDHHFLPGFPEMAWPMLDWVLGRYYPALDELHLERSVRVLGVRESDLLELMEWLVRRHKAADLFSLPRLGERASVEIGFRGGRAAIDAAFSDLISALQERSMVFEVVPA